MTITEDLRHRQEHIKYLKELISRIKKNKDTIQNITVLWDYYMPDGSTNVDFNYIGNINAILGMMDRSRNIILNGRFKNL